jgi:ATP-dependent Lon protease
MGFFKKDKVTEPKGLWWEKDGAIDDMGRRASAMFSMLSDLLGADRLVLKAGKLEALTMMRSEDLAERVIALQRIVFQDPTILPLPNSFDELPQAMYDLEDEVAEMLARKMLKSSFLVRRAGPKLPKRKRRWRILSCLKEENFSHLQWML